MNQIVSRLVAYVEWLDLAMARTTKARKATLVPDVSRLEPSGTIRGFEPEVCGVGCNELG
jgi:hypothetical protein